jgi:aspartyl-tRNA(Asn)/glutamyl-tRNA(Gln) amidotransferase subunit C
VALSADEVRHVAMLARLAVTDEEVERLGPELNAILGYAEQVGEIAAEDVPPTVHPYPLENVLRPDEPGETLDRDELMAGAPEVADDRFVVPRIVAEEG